jgi:hypothetical protein
MAKNSGKYLKFWFGGVEVPVTGVTPEADFPEIDVTDSSIVSPATDFLVGRGKRTLKIDALLAEANGTEIVTGTLVEGVRYIVTGGTITETQGAFTVGMIFTSDGTGTASATNKVRPLGVKLAGKDIACTVATVSKGVTSLKFNEQMGEFDTTDSDSSGDSTEFITGRAKSTATIELVQKTEDADLLTTSPAAQAVVLTLGTALTLTGNGIFRKKSTPVIAMGDMVKTTYDLTFVGPVESTLAGVLARGVSTAARVIFYTGATTNKEYAGNLILLSMAIDTDMNGAIKVSYAGNWDGAVTETVAN